MKTVPQIRSGGDKAQIDKLASMPDLSGGRQIDTQVPGGL